MAYSRDLWDGKSELLLLNVSFMYTALHKQASFLMVIFQIIQSCVSLLHRSTCHVGPCSPVGSESGLRDLMPSLVTFFCGNQSDDEIFSAVSFPLPLIQEGQFQILTKV